MDYDGSGITPFLCCPVARFGRTCVWQSEGRGPWDFRLLAIVYRIIGTAGPPLGSPPIREYPGPPSAKGVIIPPARKNAKLAVCPSVKGRCEGFLSRRSWRNTRPTGASGTQWFARALASPNGSVALIWGSPQTGSPGACSPVACPIGQRDRKQPGYWI